tara:strand:- start:27 stop:314 length:288 start_codon:yes stop_codon:yes gene_type:complete
MEYRVLIIDTDDKPDVIENYKSHEIHVFEHEHESGEHIFIYDIFDDSGECVESDHSGYADNSLEGAMFDVGACLENAKADIDKHHDKEKRHEDNT